MKNFPAIQVNRCWPRQPPTRGATASRNSLAAGIACLRRREYLLRLHIQESQPHGAMAHDAFQVSPPPQPQ